MTDPTSSFIAVVLLLAANGFFVAAEFALVKARGVRIDTMAAGGSRAAKLTAHIQRRLEPYLAACQLGITMASLGLGWVGEPAVAALIEPMLVSMGLGANVHLIAFIIGFLFFSSLHIVIGEQVPKTLAIRKAEPVSVWCAWPLHVFFIMCYPLNWLLNWSSGRILRLLGIRADGHDDVLSSNELSALVDVSSTHGAIGENQAAMVKNVFQFDERPVARIMVPRRDVDLLDLSAPLEETIDTVRNTQHSRLPVVDGGWDNVLGVVLLKDVLTLLLDNPEEPWAGLRGIVRSPLAVPESQRVARLFEHMRQEHAHMAFVLDEYGDFAGLVSLEDLLEEIVGDIEDEFDDPDTSVAIRATETGWEAHGLVPLADLERALITNFDENLDANTLSGLVMQRLEHLPEVGDVVVENGFRIVVKSIAHRRVELASIDPEGAADMAPAPATDKPG